MTQFARVARAGELRTDHVFALGIAIEEQSVRPHDVLACEAAGMVWHIIQKFMPNIKVMHFGLGPIGAAIVKQVAQRPGFTIVGGVDIDPAKIERDLGDVVGLPKRLGVKVAGDAAKALVDKYRVQSHYLLNGCFWGGATLLERARSLALVPAAILHGRLDWICRPQSAWELHHSLPGSRLLWLDGCGHSPFEPAMAQALAQAVLHYARCGNFATWGNSFAQAWEV